MCVRAGARACVCVCVCVCVRACVCDMYSVHLIGHHHDYTDDNKMETDRPLYRNDVPAPTKTLAKNRQPGTSYS